MYDFLLSSIYLLGYIKDSFFGLFWILKFNDAQIDLSISLSTCINRLTWSVGNILVTHCNGK